MKSGKKVILEVITISCTTVFLFIFFAIVISILLGQRLMYLYSTSISMLFVFLILPALLYRKFNLPIKFFNNVFDYKYLIRLIIYILLIILNYQNIELLVAMLVVGLTEEFFYRKIILGRLLETFNVPVSLIISSLLFAVVLHNSESFVVNITLRMFLGLILGAIAYKTKDIKDTVFIHTIYDLLV
ncbi:CPBP family intramembrane glutamic endopeptidase [Staphylococcus lutrae]|uniref:CAAX prenyl protease 2/Lysostaphin resistance protein A-like domain-containing protein n=2 Tax=Staphylococcus lutrae TaxID=155085 RepID=A0AAC9WM13_9STAP|nr:CPBP family intramembrane glutamic endopeptidase [Staphylococcus lutrae]ARJ50207.1 hypothetical protein B5P37_02140 [Staphylococcus lutrae]